LTIKPVAMKRPLRRSPAGASALGEPPAEGVEETIIALERLGPCRGLGRIGQRWCRAEPEADEQRHGLNRDVGIAFNPLDAAIDAVQPLGDNGFPPLIAIRGEE
jgi:hypothetical protein